MTADEAKANQDELAKYYSLGFWYGTNCKRCCGVYPKAMSDISPTSTKDFWYECEVCGKRTEKVTMPWIAEKYWNEENILETQLSFF